MSDCLAALILDHFLDFPLALFTISDPVLTF